MTPPRTFIAIDPGPKQSAVMLYSPMAGQPLEAYIKPNAWVLDYVLDGEYSLAIEMVASYGMAVGKDVFETVLWIGRFIQANQPRPCTKIYRKDVKMHLCHSMRAKDANIRQALIDRYPATGGGKTPQIGTKAQPGPLYGMKSHLWSALAVAVTHADQLTMEEAA